MAIALYPRNFIYTAFKVLLYIVMALALAVVFIILLLTSVPVAGLALLGAAIYLTKEASSRPRRILLTILYLAAIVLFVKGMADFTASFPTA